MSSNAQGQVIELSALDEKALVEYLHGDTPEDQLEAATYWEYSRRDEFLLLQSVSQKKSKKWFAPWECPSFPGANWCDLSHETKGVIQRFFYVPKPLVVNDCRTLERLHVFDLLKRRAANTHLNKTPAVLGHGSRLHVLVTVDLSAMPKEIADGLYAWLSEPDQQWLLKHYRESPKQGRGLAPGDRLKGALHDLAVWRLHEFYGLEGGSLWTESRHKIHRGQPRNYFRHSKGHGPVYADSKEWYAAINRARDYLRRKFGKQCFALVDAPTTTKQVCFLHLGPRPQCIDEFGLETELRRRLGTEKQKKQRSADKKKSV